MGHEFLSINIQVFEAYTAELSAAGDGMCSERRIA